MKENRYEYVDLGLPSGTMWATCNVGSVKQEDSGFLFQFGRVDGYRYGDENHKFRTNKQNLEDTRNENIPITTSGKVYNAGETLELKDDAAHVHMGGKWRMPTKNEIIELLENTIREDSYINDVKGITLISIKNKRELFIPLNGYCGFWGDGIFYSTGGVILWSSQTYDHNDNKYAYALNCKPSNVNTYINQYCNRFAFYVRGVFNNNKDNYICEKTGMNMLI